MRQYKWKKSLCMFLALLMLFSTFSTPQATFSADNVDVIENAVEEYVKSWFLKISQNIISCQIILHLSQNSQLLGMKS